MIPPENSQSNPDPLELPAEMLNDSTERLIVGCIASALGNPDWAEVVGGLQAMMPSSAGWIRRDYATIYGAALEALATGHNPCEPATLLALCRKHGLVDTQTYDLLDAARLPNPGLWRKYADTLLGEIARRNMFRAAARALDDLRNPAMQTATVAASLAAVAAVAEPAGTPEPPEPMPERVPMPLDVLPDVMRDYVRAYSAVMGCPAEYVALPMLAVAAAAIGMSRTLRLRDTWTVPPVLWLAIVGPSAAGKSPPMRAVLEPLRARQRREYRDHAAGMTAHAAAVAEHERSSARWKKSGEQTEPPIAPEPPACVRWLVDDATLEALAAVLGGNPRGVLMARDEIGGWLEGMDAYRDGGDMQRWLSIHDADEITVDRRHGIPPRIYIPHAAVSVLGGIQPAILRRLATADRVESGLMGRILLASPEPVAARWTDRDVPAHLREAWAATVNGLCDIAMDTDADGEPVARAMGLTADARSLWVAWHDTIASEALQASGPLQAATGKLREAAARLALVLALADDPHCAEVDATAMRAGIALARWFGLESRRWYADADATPQERDRAALITMIREKFDGRITPKELRTSSRRYRPAGAAEEALQGLVADGLGNWVFTTTSGRPARTFLLTGTAGTGGTGTESTVPGSASGTSYTSTAVPLGTATVSGPPVPPLVPPESPPDYDAVPVSLEEENAESDAARQAESELDV